jgi:hypothetical protein
MEREKTYYSEDLIKGAIEDLQDRIKEEEIKLDEKYAIEIDDLIHEVADNNIPIYTYDLLQYASNNFDLIYKNELCSKDADCIQIITMNIYEMLTEHLYNHINNKVEVKTKGE